MTTVHDTSYQKNLITSQSFTQLRLVSFKPYQKHYLPEDLKEKVTGAYKYAGDLVLPNIHYGGVVRAGIPHGVIRHIDVSKAERAQGVRAIVTAKDVPGLNAFGYFVPEQPVLCYDRVRYEGDAVAAIVADTPEHLLNAMELVKVTIDPLPIVDSIDDALREEAIKVHEKGNIAYTVSYEKGNFSSLFAERHIRGTYETQMVKPMYIELESTIAVYENGHLEVITTTQSPHHDRQQLARSLKIDESRIKIRFMDPGGAFGGKEEIHSQILASLLSIKGGVPVKMTFSREESNASTTRRHSFRFYIDAAINEKMKLAGLYVRAIADTGAYLSHGPGVIEVAGSHAAEPYFIPNVKYEGVLVYTNHPPAGGMRGYGASEVNFALERHIDRICRELGLDPVEFRLNNLLRPGQQNGAGIVPLSTVTVEDTLRAASSGELWGSRGSSSGLPPYIKVGYGIAVGAKSTSYGQSGDRARVRLSIDGGYMHVYFSTPDMGTGIKQSLAIIASRCLNVSPDRIKIHNDSTDYPESGTSNASRVNFMLGNAIIKACSKLRSELKRKYGESFEFSDEALSVISENGGAEVLEEYVLPNVEGGVYKKGDFIFSYATAVARVEVNTLTGQYRVTDIEFYPEAGAIINPRSFMSQMEGGIIMSLGYATMEELKISGGRTISKNFTTYMLPTAKDVPHLRIRPLEGFDPLGPYGAKGAGELPLVAVVPAIVNALVDATGKDLTRIPVSYEDLIL